MRFGRLLIAGALLSFGLSCGSPLDSRAAEETASRTTTFDDTLSIADGDSLRLETSSSTKAYLVVVERDSDFKATYLGGKAETMDISKEDLDKVFIYRLEAVGGWQQDLGSRICNEGPFICPLPPPPPPPE
jgi:hypothetical protein